MNKRYIQWFKGALVCTAVVGLAACVDDHFDIDPTVSARQTLWENISANDELSEFADVLQRVKYSNSETVVTTETYASLFNSHQTFTVWAPKNGTFDYHYYDSLLNTENPADAYTVEKELVRNSMTRFSHVMTGNDSIRLELFNGKTAWFNKAKGTMQGHKIQTPNIGATNGVLHIIDGAVAYQPNLYEFMASRADLDSVNTFIRKFQKVEFDELLSTQGPVVNGQITWVDSIYTTTNDFLTYTLNAHLTREDSIYAMILPNNDAWTTALNMTRSYYKYKETYKQDVATVTEAGTDTIYEQTTTFTPQELDSIMEVRSKSAIVSNLVFNANPETAQWGKHYTDFSVEGACDSLKTTTGKIFYDPFSARLFNGVTPVETSNGYAYVVDKFNYRPTDSWVDTMKIECESMRNVESVTATTVGSVGQFSVKDSINGIETTVARYGAYVLTPTTVRGQAEGVFIVRNLLSCKYDIYALIGYNFDYNVPNKFRAEISYDSETKREKNKRLTNQEGSRDFITRQPVELEDGTLAHLVDSVLLAKDFPFPICYEGLENAYVTIRIMSNVGTKEASQYTRQIRVDKLLFVPKE